MDEFDLDPYADESYSFQSDDDEMQKAVMASCAYACIRQTHFALKQHCPVLSGNMLRHITKKEGDLAHGKGLITISGPSYDLNAWKETGEIKPRKVWRETSQGHYKKVFEFDYAYWVNKYGAFGTSHHNSLPSKGWADRAIVLAVSRIAREYGAEVIIDL